MVVLGDDGERRPPFGDGTILSFLESKPSIWINKKRRRRSDSKAYRIHFEGEERRRSFLSRKVFVSSTNARRTTKARMIDRFARKARREGRICLSISICLLILVCTSFSGIFVHLHLERPSTSSIVEKRSRKDQRCHDFPKGSSVIYRIIGNEIPGRHAEGQTLRNLPHILENEPSLPGCQKRFVLNRIVNASLERIVMEFLRRKNVTFLRLPFQADVYRMMNLEVDCLPEPDILFKPQWDKLPERRKLRLLFAMYRQKNIYALNNNGARNAALKEGKDLAAWTLPWDGNCFVTEDAWKEIHRSMRSRQTDYLTVPMRRLEKMVTQSEKSNPNLSIDEESQIAFHCSTNAVFDEDFYYGHRPKVELLFRLAPLDTWRKWEKNMGFGLHCPRSSKPLDRKQIRLDSPTGWVVRLPSGNARLEIGPLASMSRAQARVEGVLQFLFQLDQKVWLHERTGFLSYDQHALQKDKKQHKNGADPQVRHMANQVFHQAEKLLLNRSFSITEKKFFPPSLDKHDFFSCQSGTYLVLDGKQGKCVSKSKMQSQFSGIVQDELGQYDQALLSQLFEEVSVCLLAFYLSGRRVFGDRILLLLHTFFLDVDTRMNPNMNFASLGKDGLPQKLLQMKEISLLLDAARHLENVGILSFKEGTSLREWMGAYQLWLLQSVSGIRARQAVAQQGLLYDLQVCSVSAYIGTDRILMECLARARSRLPYFSLVNHQESLHNSGTKDSDSKRDTLLGWLLLAKLAERFGVVLWNTKDADGITLLQALDFTFGNIDQGKKEWKCKDTSSGPWLLRWIAPQFCHQCSCALPDKDCRLWSSSY